MPVHTFLIENVILCLPELVRGSGKLRASWLRLGSNLVVGTYVGNGVGVKNFVTVVLCSSTLSLERELQCEFRQGGSAPFVRIRTVTSTSYVSG